MSSQHGDLHESFLRYVGQTSPFPTAFEVSRAEGCYLYDRAGRAYLDFISGISVNNLGHNHPAVQAAALQQIERYAHTMVYGEHIQEPQVELARALAEISPGNLNCTYFLSTGAEANDAALKLAAKLTGRRRFCAFHKAYHGDTVGAASCFGDETFRHPYQHILLPVTFLEFGSVEDLEKITEEIAAVLVEPVQGEGGIRIPSLNFLKSLRQRCTATGTLLIFDEVQTALGRVGDWFAATLFNVTPDLITMAKALGGGYPLGALVGEREMLRRFAAEPPFSHITTFGGHPVSCAAGLAVIRTIRSERLLSNARRMGKKLMEDLHSVRVKDERVREVRGTGLMIGVELVDSQLARRVVTGCRERGLILETTLLDERVVRVSPPLIVSEQECNTAIEIFETVLKEC